MPKQKSKSPIKKTVVVKMRKAHRIFVLTTFSLLFLSMLAAMIYVITASKFEIGIAKSIRIIPISNLDAVIT